MGSIPVAIRLVDVNSSIGHLPNQELSMLMLKTK